MFAFVVLYVCLLKIFKNYIRIYYTYVVLLCTFRGLEPQRGLLYNGYKCEMHSILVYSVVSGFFFVLNYIQHTICTYYDYTYTINIYVIIENAKTYCCSF